MIFPILVLLTIFLSCCNGLRGQNNNENVAPNRPIENIQTKVADECDFSNYKPFTVSHFVQTSLKTHFKPSYPVEAVRRGLQGQISVKILVDRDGGVVKACALNGDEILRRAAEEASLKWKFKRKVVPGRQSFVEAGISFNFVLDARSNADRAAIHP